MNLLYENVEEILSRDENDNLAIKAKKDKFAKDEIIKHNLKLVMSIANKYGKAEREDLIQEGVLGLLKALPTYDKKKGAFTTYATYWIKAQMLAACKRNEPFAYESNFYQQMVRYNKLMATVKDEEKITDAMLVESNLTRAGIEKIKAFQRKSVSLNALVDEIHEKRCNETFFDSMDVEDTVLEKIVAEEVINAIDESLSGRNAEISKSCLGLEGNYKNMVEIGKEYGLTRQRISSIQKEAKKKLSDNEEIKNLFRK